MIHGMAGVRCWRVVGASLQRLPARTSISSMDVGVSLPRLSKMRAPSYLSCFSSFSSSHSNKRIPATAACTHAFTARVALGPCSMAMTFLRPLRSSAKGGSSLRPGSRQAPSFKTPDSSKQTESTSNVGSAVGDGESQRSTDRVNGVDKSAADRGHELEQDKEKSRQWLGVDLGRVERELHRQRSDLENDAAHRRQQYQQREESSPLLSPTESILPAERRAIQVVFVILALNVAVYVAWNTYGETPEGKEFMRQNFTLSLRNLEAGHYHTVLTSAFSQSLLAHVFFNLFSLYYMAPPVALSLGAASFMGFYLAASASSSAMYLAYQNYLLPPIVAKKYGVPLDMVPRFDVPAQGASGAVMGITSLFALANPQSQLALFGVFPFRAITLVIAMVAYDSYFMYKGIVDNIAHSGHVGGALFGLVYFLLRRGRV